MTDNDLTLYEAARKAWKAAWNDAARAAEDAERAEQNERQRLSEKEGTK